MRKVKKINGYLVVRFNEREKQGYQSGGGAYPYEYVLEHYAAFQNNTLRWYTSYTQKSGNSQPVEMDSAVYQLNAAGTNYGWIAFG